METSRTLSDIQDHLRKKAQKFLANLKYQPPHADIHKDRFIFSQILRETILMEVVT